MTTRGQGVLVLHVWSQRNLHTLFYSVIIDIKAIPNYRIILFRKILLLVRQTWVRSRLQRQRGPHCSRGALTPHHAPSGTRLFSCHWTGAPPITIPSAVDCGHRHPLLATRSLHTSKPHLGLSRKGGLVHVVGT